MLKKIFDGFDWVDFRQSNGAALFALFVSLAAMLGLSHLWQRLSFAAIGVGLVYLVVKTSWQDFDDHCNRWFVDARSVYAKGEAQRARGYGSLEGQLKVLEELLPNPNIYLPYLLEAVEPRTLTWLCQETKASVLKNIGTAAKDFSESIITALSTERCQNCGIPLNGVDHSTEDFC